MRRRWMAGSPVRPLALSLLARVNPGDVHLWHPYYPRKVLVHSFHHKGYWFYRKERESDTSKFYARVIQPSDTVVEVGAHIGFETLRFASLVPQGHVLAFEPGSNNLSYLLYNCAGIPNVEVRRQAVGATGGRADFYEDNLSGQNNSLVRWGAELAESNARASGFSGLEITTTAVELVTLDAALGGLNAHFIKIKIDGGGADVISGAKAILRESRPTLMILIFAPERARLREALVEDLGYRAFTPQGIPLDWDASEPNGNVFFVHPDGPVRTPSRGWS